MGTHTSSTTATQVAIRAVSVAVVAAALTLAVAARALAHDHGVLRLVSKTFRAGDSLTIGGTKFTRSDEVTLVLVGTAGRVPLGVAPTDTAGRFSRTFLVPGTTREGQYRLVAEAIDGDEVASEEVVVQPATAAAPMVGMRVGAAHDGMPMDPTGAPLPLIRARSSAVTMTGIMLIIACVVAGTTLLRAPHAHSRGEGQ